VHEQEIIAELRRVAETLQTSRLTQQQFSQHGRISRSKVRYYFGTWNQAIKASGLKPIPSGGLPELKRQALPDDEYLQEIIRLTRELGKQPTYDELNSKGRFSDRPYRKRWGTIEKACQTAYAKYGFPRAAKATGSKEPAQAGFSPPPEAKPVPRTYKPLETQRRKKVQFGEPIDFRGLRFAPINEQGVVFVFGMISRELGFLIESIRTDYPDCEGKRCVGPQKQKWEHVLIEFEYKSSNFREHGHHPDDCDLIVCWIHDWEDCPVEVLELRSQIKYLPNRLNNE